MPPRPSELHRRLLDAGFLLTQSLSGALSTAMTEADIDALIGAVDDALVPVFA